MTDYTDLIARLRTTGPLDLDCVASEAADALEAQGREIQKAALEYVTLFGELQTALERLAEAERNLPCGHHHSLDDSYGGCVLCTTVKCHEALETELDEAEAVLRKARRALFKGIEDDTIECIDAFLTHVSLMVRLHQRIPTVAPNMDPSRI